MGNVAGYLSMTFLRSAYGMVREYAVSSSATSLPAPPCLPHALVASPPLHRDALQSILSFLDILDLVRAAGVDRAWCAAATAMKGRGLQARVALLVFEQLISSPLRKHIGILELVTGPASHLVQWEVEGRPMQEHVKAKMAELYYDYATTPNDLAPGEPKMVMSMRDFAHYCLSCGASAERARERNIRKMIAASIEPGWENPEQLSFEGFVNFYRLAINDHLECVWADLALFSPLPGYLPMLPSTFRALANSMPLLTSLECCFTGSPERVQLLGAHTQFRFLVAAHITLNMPAQWRYPDRTIAESWEDLIHCMDIVCEAGQSLKKLRITIRTMFIGLPDPLEQMPYAMVAPLLNLAPNLTELQFAWNQRFGLPFPPEYMAVFHSMPNLTSLDLGPFELTIPELMEYCKDPLPQKIQLIEMSTTMLARAHGDLLGKLTSLEHLQPYGLDMTDTSFLANLTNLKFFTMGTAFDIDVPIFISSLCHCTRMVSLSLGDIPLTDAMLEMMLTAMPELIHLSLCYITGLHQLLLSALEKVETARLSMSTLRLYHSHGIPVNAFDHIQSLKNLTVLEIVDCMVLPEESPVLNEETRKELWPKMKAFKYSGRLVEEA